MKRKISERKFDMRVWQDEAFSEILNSLKNGDENFLCVGTPGSGKTKFCLRVAHHILKENIAERVVIVTPSKELKKYWAQDAAEFAGIDVDPDFSNLMISEAEDYWGIATTYSALGSDKYCVHEKNTFQRRTFVILDEPHHMGTELNWGDSAKKAFDGAVFRLLVSGTPFRSDDNEIPFVVYENGVSKANYTYGYTRAITENVCRPVYFNIFNGEMKWKVDLEEFDADFKTFLEPDQASRRLRTALDPNGQWVRGVITAAHTKLLELRKFGHPKAAAMIFAMTQQDAMKFAKVVESITGFIPPVIISDEGKGSKKIEEFRNGSEPWLISVKMVSEGVDIPRLRVGVYLTNVKAELFFRQAVGRFVRVQKELSKQDAYMFIPEDRDIVKLAENIQEEREHALEDCDANSGESETDLFGNEYTPALSGRFIPIGSQVTDQKEIATTVGISSGMKTSVHTNKITREPSIYEQKKHLKSVLGGMAKRIAKKATHGTNVTPDWKLAHKKYTESGGKSMSLETVDELEKRIEFYKELERVV